MLHQEGGPGQTQDFLERYYLSAVLRMSVLPEKGGWVRDVMASVLRLLPELR